MKNIKIIILSISSLMFFSGFGFHKIITMPVFNKPNLKQMWITKAKFKTPESVCFDLDKHVIYVSNINGEPFEKDKNGFISQLSMNGETISLQWIKSLNAPK